MVAIGIPTYRRPARLFRLLESLLPSLAGHADVTLFVGDNGCDEATRSVVEGFVLRHPNTHYLAVPERGISANRNALIEAFLTRSPDGAFLAMLDDDLVVPPDWLCEMLSVATATDADAVGAPYASRREIKSFIVRNSIFTERPRQPSGPCAPIAAAGSILLSRRLLAADPPLRFDLAFGLSGGEDYDFFARAARRDARFAWCDEAFCEEDVDVDRLNARAVFYRYFSTGNYMAVADARFESWGPNLLRHIGITVKSAGLALVGLITLKPKRLLRGWLLMLFGIGGITATAGYRTYRYR